jgi:hypothetical protein
LTLVYHRIKVDEFLSISIYPLKITDFLHFDRNFSKIIMIGIF